MRSGFEALLCCPACRGRITLREVETREGDDVLVGRLACATCGATYPILDGVPRMLAAKSGEDRTRLGFEYQWLRRLEGRYEPPELCYGMRVGPYVDWLLEHFGGPLLRASGNGSPGGVLLDAGCGSGEKTRELALRLPGHQVIGLDLSSSLGISAARSRHIPNLEFVQADIQRSPLPPASVPYALSIGVLPHTPDTRRALGSLAELVTDDGALLTWIYPLPDEDPFWAYFYRLRDRHFLGRAHRLPHRLLMTLCHLYVTVRLPWFGLFFYKMSKVYRERYPFLATEGSLGQLYKTAVFFSFDTLMPPRQLRHGRPEVAEWYREVGFEDPREAPPGFFFAERS